MALISWRPFLKDWEDLFEELGEFPRLPIVIEEPKIDIYEEDNNLVVEMDVAGIDPSKLQVSIKDNVLRAEGGEEKKVEEKKKDYYRKEIRRGYIKKVVSLPIPVDESKAQATCEDGILKIVVPKVKPVIEKPGKKIEVKVKKK